MRYGSALICLKKKQMAFAAPNIIFFKKIKKSKSVLFELFCFTNCSGASHPVVALLPCWRQVRETLKDIMCPYFKLNDEEILDPKHNLCLPLSLTEVFYVVSTTIITKTQEPLACSHFCPSLFVLR